MRIVHCIHGLGLGGAQKVVETLVRTLAAPGLSHHVYCSLDGPVRKSIESAGAKVRVIPRHLPKFDPIWARQLSDAMRVDKVDLVHTHLFGDSLHGLLAARSAGELPVVMTLHNNQGRFNRLQKLGYRWLLPRCQAIVACASSVGSSFVDSQPRLKGKLVVIPNGIAFERPPELTQEEEAILRADLGLDLDSSVLVAMGRFVEQKGYTYLIRAFSELPDPMKAHSQLLLLGQGPLEKSLRDLSDSLGISKNVVLGGYRQDVNRILGITDVVVFSSLWEGLPIALLEAMAAEKCIVATDIQSFRDVVDNEVEAVLSPSADPAALSAALQRVLADAKARRTLGQNAREKYLADYGASKMASCYEKIYREVMRAKPVPSP